MRTLYFYRFRYFDTMRNKWLTARYVAQREKIEKRYIAYAIVGAPETRHVPDDWLYSDASQLVAGAQRTATPD